MKSWRPDPNALRGRIAVVAGATGGAGRGIAAALGEAGAAVFCSGRSSRSRAMQSDYDRPETIEETAELVTSLGGNGIPIVADHLDADQVRRLSDRVRDAHGHIDILVNDIWGAEQLKGGPPDWNKPIWQLDLHKGLRILRLAIDTHLITSYYLLPLLINRSGGLLVEVADGTSDYNASHLTGFLGGAVAAHVRVGEPVFVLIFPVILGAILWGGLYLRDERLRALIPWRHSYIPGWRFLAC